MCDTAGQTERMTNTAATAPAFDLYVPNTGTGTTHLHAENRTGILCGDPKARYRTFNVVGIVPAGSATCESCNRKAQAIADTR